MLESINFVLVGVGGQGTILASDILSDMGLKLGYDVKKAEVHGMSQRGGSVISHLRWANEVHSPIIAQGEGDVLIAFEKIEAVRFVNQLKPGGLALVNWHQITPLTVNTGKISYPEDEPVRKAIQDRTNDVHWLDGVRIAEELGNVRTANVVILGALSALLKHSSEPWLEVIESRVPEKFIALNRKAFEAGRNAV